jgi:secreted trypsin-like serine protease
MVLTAAHCIFPIPTPPSSASVKIMRQDLNSNDGEEIKVIKFIPHPDYDKPDVDYALLVLERATTQDIKLIKLNSDENFPAPGSVAHVMGWGDTNGYNTTERLPSDVALEADVNVVSNAECDSKWGPDRIEAFHICTFDQDKAACQGDSGEIQDFYEPGLARKHFSHHPFPPIGGPLIILGASPEQDVQIGIVSFNDRKKDEKDDL